MNSLRKQLFNDKTLPYISKKQVNDLLCESALSCLNKNFYQKTLNIVLSTIENECVVQGDAAFDIYADPLSNTLNNIDLQVITNNVAEVTIDNVYNIIPLQRLKNNLQKITEQHQKEMETIVSKMNLSHIIKMKHFNKNKIVIFKSYTDEAVEFVSPAGIYFELNKIMPLKITVCSVDNSIDDKNHILARYSFNVHAKSTNPIWLHTNDDRSKIIEYFPLDLYFLNLRIKPLTIMDKLQKCQMFGKQMYVNSLEQVICDQLESIMFKVFYDNVNENEIEKLYSLITATKSNVCEQHKFPFDKIVRYTIKDVKSILYALGPRNGAETIVKLYCMKRFSNRLNDITHQINFPYCYWDTGYYSKCWKRYCKILIKLFDINIKIHS
ncbi:ac18 [Erannis ankeraria nucleopolyhedrovirus]|uniref:ac18 n=1 Tax=Erannis ankeraria nucleopolyhedrovirus TaxID=2913600 RepID=UPI002481AA45|nr:ac18 [Erannis ankeraria nucleopolyhedrovirus]UJZ89067.1 ac18 [Erannis ankeraria nucleopolyhedrovirus]